VVVDDDGSHLRRREIGVVEPNNKALVVFSTEGLSDEPLAPSWRKKNHRVSQVDHGDPAAVVEPPSMAHGGRD
jgi:hypothetical protein